MPVHLGRQFTSHPLTFRRLPAFESVTGIAGFERQILYIIIPMAFKTRTGYQIGRANHLLFMDSEPPRLSPLLRACPFFLVLAGFRRRLGIGFLRHATRLEFWMRFFVFQATIS